MSQPNIKQNILIVVIAQILCNWPDPCPLYLHDVTTRYKRLLRTIAGYPEILPGILPNDQPLHPLAKQAQELSFNLDSWPPLAGKGSLRSELLWLDQMRSDQCFFCDQTPSEELWLKIILAWTFAGLQPAGFFDEGSHPIVLDLLFDPEELPKAVKDIKRIQGELMICNRICDHAVVAKDFATQVNPLPENQINPVKFAQFLWWVRSRTALIRGRENSRKADPSTKAPKPVEPPMPKEQGGIMEVRFHHIKQWLIDIASNSTNHKTEDKFFGIALRGASFFLEAVISSIRIGLIDRLGVGNLIIDGGHRLQFRYGSRHQPEDLYALIIDIIDRLLYPGGPIYRRFGIIFHMPHVKKHFKSMDRAEANGHDTPLFLRELAWHLVPTICITFPSSKMDSTCLPFRQVWQDTLIEHKVPCAAIKNAYHRRLIPMSLRKRIFTEIGVFVPRERILGLHISEAVHSKKTDGLPMSTDPIVKMLLIDLNGIGHLFEWLYVSGKDADHEAIDYLERISRCSFRFLVNWLNIIRNAVWAFGPTAVPEPLILAGDDLVIGARNSNTHLLGFAMRLYEGIVEMNNQLPADKAITFCGLLFDDLTTRSDRAMLLFRAMVWEKQLKEIWQDEIARQGNLGAEVPMVEDFKNCRWIRMGYGNNMCLLVEMDHPSCNMPTLSANLNRDHEKTLEAEGRSMSLNRQMELLHVVPNTMMNPEITVYADSSKVIVRSFNRTTFGL
ncbi:MAG: hypothetical protein AB1547_13570 [Thermodesulfobacteriota bacterium]